jgi:hypothetical protein
MMQPLEFVFFSLEKSTSKVQHAQNAVPKDAIDVQLLGESQTFS